MPSQALNHGSSVSEIQTFSSAFYAPHDTGKKNSAIVWIVALIEL